jgi:hypothetical protein
MAKQISPGKRKFYISQSSKWTRKTLSNHTTCNHPACETKVRLKLSEDPGSEKYCRMHSRKKAKKDCNGKTNKRNNCRKSGNQECKKCKKQFCLSHIGKHACN